MKKEAQFVFETKPTGQLEDAIVRRMKEMTNKTINKGSIEILREVTLPNKRFKVVFLWVVED